MRLQIEEKGQLWPEELGLFRNCHSSTIVLLPDNEKLVACFAGEREGTPDNAIWLCRGSAHGWETPVRTMVEPGVPHWNPILYAEGARVWLFYKVGTTVHDWTARIVTSVDAGRTWTAPRALVPGDLSPRGPVRNKIIRLQDGAWLAGGSVEDDRYWDAFSDRSEDAGATWVRAAVPLTHRTGAARDEAAVWEGLRADALWETDLDRVFQWDGVIQPSLWESAPGQVHMLLRSTRGQVFRSDSADGGRSWCEAYATSLPNNNSGLDVVRLADGALVLAYNPVSGNWGRRTPMSLAGSSDGGQTWAPLVDLATGPGEFSYPAIIADGDTLHVTFTSNRTTIIYHRLRVMPDATKPRDAEPPARGTAP